MNQPTIARRLRGLQFPRDDDTVHSAAYHAEESIRARLDVLRAFPWRHDPDVRRDINKAIALARYHEAKCNAIAAGLPLVC